MRLFEGDSRRIRIPNMPLFDSGPLHRSNFAASHTSERIFLTGALFKRLIAAHSASSLSIPLH